MAITLANTYTIEYGFIDKEFAEKVCQVFKIKSQYLIKSKQILGFDSRATKSIIYVIESILTTGTYIESLSPLLITNLRNHLIIFG